MKDSAIMNNNPIVKTPKLIRLFKITRIVRMLRMLKLLRVFKIQKFIIKVKLRVIIFVDRRTFSVRFHEPIQYISFLDSQNLVYLSLASLFLLVNGNHLHVLASLVLDQCCRNAR